MTLTVEIERAARVDGCSRLQVLWYVIVPMAIPGISVASIIAFLFCWNELLFGIILVGGTGGQTLSPALLAIGPLTASGISLMVLFAAASKFLIAPSLELELIFERFVTRLSIVDPTITRDTWWDGPRYVVCLRPLLAERATVGAVSTRARN